MLSLSSASHTLTSSNIPLLLCLSTSLVLPLPPSSANINQTQSVQCLQPFLHPLLLTEHSKAQRSAFNLI